jgi:hypothetical protein
MPVDLYFHLHCLQGVKFDKQVSVAAAGLCTIRFIRGYTHAPLTPCNARCFARLTLRPPTHRSTTIDCDLLTSLRISHSAGLAWAIHSKC